MKPNFGFTFGRTPEGQKRDLEELERRLSEQEKTRQTPNTTQQTKTSIKPTINNSGDYWRIPVNYKNGIYQVDLAKSLLDNGNFKTQDEWAGFTEESKQKGNFYVGDMPLYYSLFRAFTNAQGKDAEEAKEFIKTQMREKWLLTLTRIKYHPNGNDEVIHNFGTSEQYATQKTIIGSEGDISQVSNPEALEALVGTCNIQEINQTFNVINGTPTYLLRKSQSPDKTVERVARFVAVSGGAYLNCDGGPSIRGASLGVRIASVASNKAKI